MLCYGDSLNAGDAFDNYKWSSGGRTLGTTPFIHPQNSGWYKAEVSTNDGCVLKDSIQIRIDHPVVELGPDRGICAGDSVILDAGSQMQVFSLLTGFVADQDTVQKITVFQSGTYGVEVTDM